MPETEQTRKTALAQRINACALQRALFDRAQSQLRSFNGLVEAVALARSPAEQNSTGKGFGWSSGWDPATISDIEIALDAESTRVRATAHSWRDLAIFARRVSDRSRIEFAVADATNSRTGIVAFRLEPRASFTPLRGVTFGPELFPPKKTDSLQEYADQMCDFGGDSAPVADGNDGTLVFEKLGSVDAGDWQHNTLRVRLSDWSTLDRALQQVRDYQGLTAHIRGQDLIVDIYRTTLSDDFDPATWLAKHVRTLGTDHARLGAPPEGIGLITWREENDFPVGLSRTVLAGVSWYGYKQVHRLYHALADAYDRVALADTVRESNARALRASLCLTRAYTQPLDNVPDAQTRSLHAAKLVFRAPLDGKVDDLAIEQVRLFADGRTEWTLTSSDKAKLDGARRAFERCMGPSEIDAALDEERTPIRWSGTGVTSAQGLFEPRFKEVELPRFEDGREFVMEIRHNQDRFHRKLEVLNRRFSSTNGNGVVEGVVSSRAKANAFVAQVAESAQAFATDVLKLRRRPLDVEGWEAVSPELFEIEAAAKPTDLLGFVAQAFDLQHQIVPSRIVIEPHEDGEHLVLRGTFYTFSHAH